MFIVFSEQYQDQYILIVNMCHQASSVCDDAVAQTMVLCLNKLRRWCPLCSQTPVGMNELDPFGQLRRWLELSALLNELFRSWCIPRSHKPRSFESRFWKRCTKILFDSNPDPTKIPQTKIAALRSSLTLTRIPQRSNLFALRSHKPRSLHQDPLWL